jgi:hypothetical protein
VLAHDGTETWRGGPVSSVVRTEPTNRAREKYHEANLTPQIFPCRQITSQLRVWPPSAKANSNRSGTGEGLAVEILAPPWEISITRHSASVRSCTLIDACMLRVRRTSRLMRFLSLGIGQTYVKSAPFLRKCRRARCRRLLLATAGSHSGAVASAYETAVAWLTKR